MKLQVEGDVYRGYMGPPKWEHPFATKKTYPVSQIIAAAKRFERDNETDNGYQLRLLATERKIPSKMHRSNCGVVHINIIGVKK